MYSAVSFENDSLASMLYVHDEFWRYVYRFILVFIRLEMWKYWYIFKAQDACMHILKPTKKKCQMGFLEIV